MSKRELTIPVSELAAICNGVMGGVVTDYHYCMKNKNECIKTSEDVTRYNARLEGVVTTLETILTLYEAQNIYFLYNHDTEYKELQNLKDVVNTFKFRVIGKMYDDINHIITNK